MDTRQELMTVIQQISEEKLPSLLEFAQSLKQSEEATHQPPLDVRTFLKLPLVERQKLLIQQADLIAPYFQPGTEDMEWVEEYAENDDWDNE